MNAPEQLSMFEPEGAEALALLQRYLRETEQHLNMSDRMELLGMPGASDRAHRLAEESARAALSLAMLLDFEREAGL
jgi:hypothetical protein